MPSRRCASLRAGDCNAVGGNSECGNRRQRRPLRHVSRETARRRGLPVSRETRGLCRRQESRERCGKTDAAKSHPKRRPIPKRRTGLFGFHVKHGRIEGIGRSRLSESTEKELRGQAPHHLVPALERNHHSLRSQSPFSAVSAERNLELFAGSHATPLAPHVNGVGFVSALCRADYATEVPLGKRDLPITPVD